MEMRKLIFGISILVMVIAILLPLQPGGEKVFAEGDAIVKGKITNDLGEPIENAHFSPSVSGEVLVTYTDQNGFYEIELPEGTYWFKVYAEGYEVQYIKDYPVLSGDVIEMDFTVIPIEDSIKKEELLILNCKSIDRNKLLKDVIKVQVNKGVVKLSTKPYSGFSNSLLQIYFYEVEDDATIRAVEKLFLTADKNGKIKLKQELPPGNYEVWVWFDWSDGIFKEKIKVD
ncbi:carboxypeptidase regulatory-like domain-containing protein [Anaerobacillus sp. MEB173]|uniref:carboxypeptidase-like regulatory domain-containing protein n=1 Tax=Anaerobacillus sp. MEB173 TaxID=3383345 RepID=UPI003F915F47